MIGSVLLPVFLLSGDAAAVSAKPLYVCDADIGSRRHFEREHGAPAVFVTAEQALTAPEGWATPRCITEGEHRKLVRRMAASTATADTALAAAPRPTVFARMTALLRR